MTENKDQAEMQQLVLMEEEQLNSANKFGEATPPVSPAVNKRSPESIKDVSSSGGISVRGATSLASSSSRSLSRVATVPTLGSSHTSNLNSGSNVTDVRRMETALLSLLEDFHSGNLRAFGKDCSMDQMTGIREQQERLAKLHFELGAAQELYAPLSEEGLREGRQNMAALMSSLEQLSESIEALHSFSSGSRE